MTLWERVVEANRPGPPEHSCRFRVASTLTVVVAIAACWSQSELSAPLAMFTIVATIAGNALSYWRREHPWHAVKPILAACILGGFAWFAVTVTHDATPGDISTVVAPLAALFAWVLSTHAFDIPARRDVAYSLAGSAALMAVAAAQNIDLSLGLYVVVWLICGLWGLVAMWQSMSGSNSVPWTTLGVAGLVVAFLTVVIVAVLPAPSVAASLVFPSSSKGDSPISSPNNLTDGGPSALPAKAASPQGRIGIGGFLGFAKSLDTGVRATLGNQIVMRVRAGRPSYWVGQTYDTWNGQSWFEAADPASGPTVKKLTSGSPFPIPLTDDAQADLSPVNTDIQTFYLAQSGPNLIFHADNAERVYLDSPSLFVTGDGTIVSGTSMGSGTVYTVVSSANIATAPQLRNATVPASNGIPLPALSPQMQKRYLQLPSLDPRISTLARRITAGIGTAGTRPSARAGPHTYDKVAALEAWMSTHIHYSTNIPPLAPGQDAVSSFLFGSRIGYCEQISSATTVMLRTLGIPAREAVGYVPGSYNPITDLYQVEAKDAHAWVQVWFPGYGWQNFDPTADVPLANPTPGSIIVRSTENLLHRLPWIPIGVVVALVVTEEGFRRRLRRRPRTWVLRVAADLERAGSRSGMPRAAGETLATYCARLAIADPGSHDQLSAAAAAVEGFAYGGIEPSAPEIASVSSFAHHFEVKRSGNGRVRGHGGGGGAHGSHSGGGVAGGQVRDNVSASSKEAPSASSVR